MKHMTIQNNPKDIFWGKYEKLPDVIKNAVFSEKNYKIISDICERNDLHEETSKSQLMKYVGKTLIGELPIKEFYVIIELEMELETNVAKKISEEIDQKIFSHLRIDLNKLYSSNIAKNKNLSNNENNENIKKLEQDGKEESKNIKNEEKKDPYKEDII